MGINFKRKKWIIQDEWGSLRIVKEMYGRTRLIFAIIKIEVVRLATDKGIALIPQIENISIIRCNNP